MSKTSRRKMRPPIADRKQVGITRIDDSERKSVLHFVNDRNFFLWWVPIFILAAFLRLYMLPGQILIDDEWHGIAFIFGKTFWEALTAFNPLNNSSPILTAYTLLLYRTLGISEMLLRIPVVLAGLASLIILPWSVKKIFGTRVALIFSALLAISPFLIFYSRFFRAYILIMLFSFWGLLSFFHWVTTGQRRYAIFSVLSGSVAVYAHPISLVVVMIPFVLLFFIFCTRDYFPQFFRSFAVVIPPQQFFALFSITALLVMFLSWPILAHRADLPLFKDGISLNGLMDAVTLLCGTANFPLVVIFVLMLIAGQILILKRQPLIGWIFATVILAYFLFLSFTGPFGIGNGFVMLRYMIPAVPMGILLVALALEYFCKALGEIPFLYSTKARIFISSLPVIFVGLLLAFGPIIDIYVYPNNFTNHSAFQGSYQSPLWKYADAHNIYTNFPITKENISPFYISLISNVDIKTLIDYPFDVCSYNNVFYFYQHFDRKRRIAGYSSVRIDSGVEIEEYPDGITSLYVGNGSIDDVLRYNSNPDRLRFTNIIDIENDAELSKLHDAALVLHKSLMAPLLMSEKQGFVKLRYTMMNRFITKFQQTCGAPLYEDNEIVVFKIK